MQDEGGDRFNSVDLKKGEKGRRERTIRELREKALGRGGVTNN